MIKVARIEYIGFIFFIFWPEKPRSGTTATTGITNTKLNFSLLNHNPPLIEVAAGTYFYNVQPGGHGLGGFYP